ncbi:hypothetical protein AX16_002779 [Volvariella volvacea WC 439]|nr:hypothetical protein AX16_002779 [Volvariella volvacea WC 439]
MVRPGADRGPFDLDVPDLGWIPEDVSLRTDVNILYLFSNYCHVQDVPDDLLEPVIWALKAELCTLMESPEYGCAGSDEESGKTTMYINVMTKLARHLMKSRISRHKEAIPYLKECIKLDGEHFRNSKHYICNPYVLSSTSATRPIIQNQISLRARNVLEKALEGFEAIRTHTSGNQIAYIFKTRINLIITLKELGVDESIRQSHESWSVEFLKRNPDMFMDKDLREILMKPQFAMHPVLTALGGEKWFQKRRLAAVRICMNCGLREPEVKLFRCAACRYSWYCSKDCQKADWKSHKPICRPIAEDLKEVEKMKLEDPVGVKFDSDWGKWLKSFALLVPIHALNLHRDINRGRTHIMIYGVTYTPSSRNLKDKISIVAAGVYKVDEVMYLIEDGMRLSKGEGPKYVKQELQKHETLIEVEGTVAVLYLVMNRDHQRCWFGCAPISAEDINRVSYNRNWRKLLDEKRPPQRMMLAGSPKDREHTF